MFQIRASSFDREYILNNGATFSGVRMIEVEMISSGSFELHVVGQGGEKLATAPRVNPNGGWNTFDFTGGEINVSAPKYILKFVNTSPGTKKIKQGTVQP
jgi:hypothetical protein